MENIEITIMLVDYLILELIEKCNSNKWQYKRHNETHISIYVPHCDLWKLLFIGHSVLSVKPY